MCLVRCDNALFEAAIQTLMSTHELAITETSRMKYIRKILSMGVAIAVSVAFSGCETLIDGQPVKKKKKDSSSWSPFKKKEYQIPQSLNVTWSHDIMTLPGKPATRGFGGRFYFYNEKTQTIPVDGDLLVYGFDDTFKQKGTEDLSQADKRFRFTAEQLTTHFSQGELGASYSVWIPWDAAYGNHKKIMLIPTFLTKDGRTVRGAPANLNLPGKSNEDPNAGIIPQTSSVIPTVLPEQFVDARTTANSNNSSGMRTTTIQVPSKLLTRNGKSSDLRTQFTDGQTQQNYVGMNPNVLTQTLGTSPNDSATQASFLSAPGDTAPQKASATSATPAEGVFAPQTMPLMRPGFSTSNANGWALPEFSPVTSTVQPHRSSPN